MDKKAVSLMVSYVILIGIVIALALSVTAWWKSYANVEPSPDCKKGTSLIIKPDYECSIVDGEGSINLTIKNNGRFSVDGFKIIFGNDTDKAPRTYLIWNEIKDMVGGSLSKANIKQVNFFDDPLKSGDSRTYVFISKTIYENSGPQSVDFNYIRKIQMQPFIRENEDNIMCTNALVDYDIEDCQIKH